MSTIDKLVVHKPRVQGILPLILSAEKRQDEIGKQILSQRNNILGGKIKVKFHSACLQNILRGVYQ